MDGFGRITSEQVWTSQYNWVVIDTTTYDYPFSREKTKKFFKIIKKNI